MKKFQDSFSFLNLLIAVASGISVYWAGGKLIDYIGHWPAMLVLGLPLGFLIWWLRKQEKAKGKVEKFADSFSFLDLLIAVASGISIYWAGGKLIDYIGHWPAMLVLGLPLGFLIWWLRKQKAKGNPDRPA